MDIAQEFTPLRDCGLPALDLLGHSALLIGTGISCIWLQAWTNLYLLPQLLTTAPPDRDNQQPG